MIREEDLVEILENTTETVKGYPVKNLIHHKGLRKYIGGLVKDPIYGKATLRNGYVGCSWFINGDAMPQGYKKPRKDFKLKFVLKKKLG